MKNITINNNVWKELKRIKKKHNFKQIGQAVEYLQNHQLLPEAIMNDNVSIGKYSGSLEGKTDILEIRKYIDSLKPINLEENLIKKHPSVIIRCMRCNHLFKLDKIIADESAIVCSGCGFLYELMFLEDKEGEAI